MDSRLTLLTILVGLAALWLVAIGLFWLVRPRGVPIGELLRLVPDTLRLIPRIGDGRHGGGIRHVGPNHGHGRRVA